MHSVRGKVEIGTVSFSLSLSFSSLSLVSRPFFSFFLVLFWCLLSTHSIHWIFPSGLDPLKLSSELSLPHPLRSAPSLP